MANEQEQVHSPDAPNEVPPAGPVAQTVEIKNERGVSKNYETVASRLARFRHAHPDYTTETEILDCNDEVVRMRARIGLNYADPAGIMHTHWLATAHAEEYRSTEGINATSALENCETSAFGRALAMLGFASPESIASADEVRGAQRKAEIIQKAQPGALIKVQQAAKLGMKELQRVWETVLSEDDRNACRGSLGQMKKIAKKADDDRAHGIKDPDPRQNSQPKGMPPDEDGPPDGP